MLLAKIHTVIVKLISKLTSLEIVVRTKLKAAIANEIAFLQKLEASLVTTVETKLDEVETEIKSVETQVVQHTEQIIDGVKVVDGKVV